MKAIGKKRKIEIHMEGGQTIKCMFFSRLDFLSLSFIATNLSREGAHAPSLFLDP